MKTASNSQHGIRAIVEERAECLGSRKEEIGGRAGNISLK